ncbi:CHAP domain-containing protein [Streptococcus dysgalactiae subsp. dysgalactiae]|nr:CHAP domain-containing protein [Streptococcus dysgalactiae subsp. dysgalactiae]
MKKRKWFLISLIIPFFFLVFLLFTLASESSSSCEVSDDSISTSVVTNSASASESDWTKKGTTAYNNAKGVFDAFVQSGTSGAFASGVVGWVNSEGGFTMIGRAEGHFGNDLKTNSIAFGVKPSGLAYYTTEAGGGIYQFTPYTKYAPLGSPDWENADKMTKFVLKAISNGDWNASMDLTGKHHSLEEAVQLTNPQDATLTWQAYERGSVAHINQSQKKSDAQKAYEMFDGEKYSYNDSKFKKNLGKNDTSSSSPVETVSQVDDLIACDNSESGGKVTGEKSGKVAYTSYNAWKPDQLPNDLKQYAIDPKSVGLAYRNSNGWNAIASTGGQCTDLSASLMYGLWLKGGIHPSQRMGNGNMVVSNWVSHFGGKSDGTPSTGEVFSCSGSTGAGHTGVVSHVFANGDILIVEQNFSSYSGDNGGFGQYSWNYRYVTTKEFSKENYSFYNPSDVGYKLSDQVKMVGG